jgi:hypothetical protein
LQPKVLEFKKCFKTGTKELKSGRIELKPQPKELANRLCIVKTKRGGF